MPKVVLIDDHSVVLKGLMAVISAKPGWQVVGATTDPAEGLKIIAQDRLDLAIVDYSMAGMDGVELTRRAIAIHPALQVLIFTMHHNDAIIRDLLTAGARGFVLKSDASEMLDAALASLAAGEPFLPGHAGTLLLRSYLGKDVEKNTALTPREREVMKQIALGLSSKEVGQKLEISPKTVEIHRTAIMRKLELSNVAELVRHAIRNGLIDA